VIDEDHPFGFDFKNAMLIAETRGFRGGVAEVAFVMRGNLQALVTLIRGKIHGGVADWEYDFEFVEDKHLSPNS
jgi:hypothetical protein